MRDIPLVEVVGHLRAENIWWNAPNTITPAEDALGPRAYLDLFIPLVIDTDVRRAVLLMGPRRVGKTVLLRHTIRELLRRGVAPQHICYVSVDHPIYTGRRLDELFKTYLQAAALESHRERLFVFFDEIQYLRDWEIHLKALVDAHPEVRFVASGSAAAALKLKSQESGAGRFTDFLLPPLTFYEYIQLRGAEALVARDAVHGAITATDLTALNEQFVDYLNFGGYPEVALSKAIQADPGRFVKADIIDKVLLRDLPSLYGIQDVQELNALFTTLAFNTANEVSLEKLTKHSGVAKNTIKRYIEYLEAAFLLRVVHRVDRSARRFQRATAFKVYLTNPSMRAALFAPVAADDAITGDLVETAVFAQWFHRPGPLHYARWGDGEVDLVWVDARAQVQWALEVKWSDRGFERPSELEALVRFCAQHKMADGLVTTRTARGIRVVDGVRLRCVPASMYCYVVGFNLIHQRAGNLDRLLGIEEPAVGQTNR